MTILRASSFACASAPEINTSQFGCHICSQHRNIARDCYFTGRVLQFGWEAACLLQRQRTLAKHCICIVANIKLELDQTVNTTYALPGNFLPQMKNTWGVTLPKTLFSRLTGLACVPAPSTLTNMLQAWMRVLKYWIIACQTFKRTQRLQSYWRKSVDRCEPATLKGGS